MIASIIAAALVVPPPASTDVNRILSAIAAVATGRRLVVSRSGRCTGRTHANTTSRCARARTPT